MSSRKGPVTRLCRYTESAIFVREADLVEDLIGKVSFTDMIFLDAFARLPTPQQRAMMDAVLVTLTEHGMTPSAIAARLVYSSAPEALQGAIAAGLLGAGSVSLGTIENSAQLLEEICMDPAGIQVAVRSRVQEYHAQKRRVPGFGHGQHKPDDPRSPKLLELARHLGIAGRRVEALNYLSTVVDEVYGKHITINASAAMAAVLLEIGVPPRIMRGIAVIARCAGLVAHVLEEQNESSGVALMNAGTEAVPYEAAQASVTPQ